MDGNGNKMQVDGAESKNEGKADQVAVEEARKKDEAERRATLEKEGRARLAELVKLLIVRLLLFGFALQMLVRR
jgi:hypothetical protein